MALRFHPDKALANCRFAVRLSGAGALLAGARAIQDRIRSEADWLFICIGEARTVLEDAGKRAQVLLAHTEVAMQTEQCLSIAAIIDLSTRHSGSHEEHQ